MGWPGGTPGSKKTEEFQEGATGELLEFLHVFFRQGAAGELPEKQNAILGSEGFRPSRDCSQYLLKDLGLRRV